MARVFALGKDRWDPTNRFETSWILPPYVLGLCRALFSIFQFVVLLYNIGFYCTHERRGGCAAAANTFSYFTVLTYWGLAFYFAAAAAHTLTYAATGRALLDRLPRALQALHSAYYTSVVVYPFIVTVVYWGVLFRPGALAAPFDLFSNVSEHALNAGFALFEILVPRTAPPPWLHLLWLVVGLALYLALAYVTRATKGFYTYSFLDPRRNGGLVAAYVFGIAVGCAVVFALAWAAIWLRRWATEDKLGMRGKMSPKAEWRRRDDEDVEMTGHHQESWSERGKAVQESSR